MRKSVVSILTWPLRFLRRLLGLLAKPFRKRDKPAKDAKPPKAGKQSKPNKQPKAKRSNPLKKVTGLKGKPRIAALVIVGVVVVVAVLALRPGPNEEKDVRAALEGYGKASAEKDYQRLCDDLLSSALVEQIRNAGLPCEVALRTGLEDRRSPTLTVLGVEVSGDQALARARTAAIGEVPSVDTIKLVKEDGGWRIASLSEPGSQLSGSTP